MNETEEILARDVQVGDLVDLDGAWREVAHVDVDEGVALGYFGDRGGAHAVSFTLDARVRRIDEHVELEPDERHYHEEQKRIRETLEASEERKKRAAAEREQIDGVSPE